MKAAHRGGDVIGEAEGVVFEEGGEVEGEGEAFGAVGMVGLAEGGVCGLAGDDGLGVVFTARDLGIERGVELFGELRVGAGVEGDFLFVVEPIEVAPDFAGVEFAGACVGREAAAGFEGSLANGEVGGVFVGGVMGVANFGLALKEAVFELGDAGLAVLGIFDGGAGVVEAFDEAVLREVGGADLFLLSAGDKLGVAIIGVGAGAGTTRAVGADDAAKPGKVLLVACADSVVGHELEVVGVGADGEVGATGKGFRFGHGVGNVEEGSFEHGVSLGGKGSYLKQEMEGVWAFVLGWLA